MKALFLDRDGTLIVDVGYPRDPAQVALIPGAIDALKAWNGPLVIISNQSGVARGRITPDEAAAVHARTVELFAEHGIRFAGAYYCFHGPDDGCRCRKPMPGMLLDAARELGLELSNATMLGDKPSDVAAGVAAGARGVLFTGDWSVLR